MTNIQNCAFTTEVYTLSENVIRVTFRRDNTLNSKELIKQCNVIGIPVIENVDVLMNNVSKLLNGFQHNDLNELIEQIVTTEVEAFTNDFTERHRNLLNGLRSAEIDYESIMKRLNVLAQIGADHYMILGEQREAESRLTSLKHGVVRTIKDRLFIERPMFKKSLTSVINAVLKDVDLRVFRKLT
jgi:hypothetical protein